MLSMRAFSHLLGRRFTSARNSRNVHDARRRERGQSLAEMAIVLPFFLVLIVGVIEVANGLNAYMTVVNSARDGARLASKGNASDDAVRNLVISETDRLRDDIDASDIDVVYTTVDGVEAVKVTVCNEHTLLLGVPLVMDDNYRMCSTTAMRVYTN
jgi:Flp pilus assembly protein TadG